MTSVVFLAAFTTVSSVAFAAAVTFARDVTARSKVWARSMSTGPWRSQIWTGCRYGPTAKACTRNAGLLRPDVTTDDLVLLSGSLSQAVLTAGDRHPGQWRRLLRISLDGLSSRNTEPLPEPTSHVGTLRND
ncbi:hypothetical protein [Streptomyces sp. NBC_01716]|uniref:hypothetical protein n=2 Tax=unclassified Streptomyces TaxID=2593676 RepID=UPI002E320299|nr:hypothetical protein [Streptomyces sp. NBC_01716]